MDDAQVKEMCDDIKSKMQESNCNLETLHNKIVESAGDIGTHVVPQTTWAEFDQYTVMGNEHCSAIPDFSMPDCKLSLSLSILYYPFQPIDVV